MWNIEAYVSDDYMLNFKTVATILTLYLKRGMKEGVGEKLVWSLGLNL